MMYREVKYDTVERGFVYPEIGLVVDLELGTRVSTAQEQEESFPLFSIDMRGLEAFVASGLVN